MRADFSWCTFGSRSALFSIISICGGASPFVRGEQTERHHQPGLGLLSALLLAEKKENNLINLSTVIVIYYHITNRRGAARLVVACFGRAKIPRSWARHAEKEFGQTIQVAYGPDYVVVPSRNLWAIARFLRVIVLNNKRHSARERETEIKSK